MKKNEFLKFNVGFKELQFGGAYVRYVKLDYVNFLLCTRQQISLYTDISHV